jgi:spermidine synthase
MSYNRVLYGGTVFLSAFLLFLIEPIAAKELLPALGGSSAVWVTCLVFFQGALLCGYAYAHWLARRKASQQRLIHLLILVAALLVVGLSNWLRRDLSDGPAHPVRSIFAALALSIGLPFLLLGSTTSLLQIWLARSEGKVPYRLFALSNVGSLLALILYPFVVEPYLTLRSQRGAWSSGFVVYAILCGGLAWRLRGDQVESITTQPIDHSPSPLRSKLLWFLLPMIATIQLSAITSHLTSNIAAIPLLWIMPLGAYLLSFIVAFEFPALYQRGIVVRFLVLMQASLAYALSKMDFSLSIGVGIIFFVLDVFVACLFCHAETYALRPARSSETTLFYLLIAAGGVTGTFLIGIVSPFVFRGNYDLAIAFFLTAILALVVTWSDGWPQRLLWATSSVLLFALIIMLRVVTARETLLQTRNFYGTLRVKQTNMPAAVQPVRLLLHGTIQHGTQLFAPGMSRIPTTYYAPDSGVGLALDQCCGSAPRRIGVIGLGTGTIAAYGRPGDQMRFYEINPLVRPIAQGLFTYLRDSHAQITFAEGDARSSLNREQPQRFDVLVIDAFSGDAIPLHLLTTEAMQVYRKHLAPGGILAFHVSNQYLNLGPEIALLADSADMEARAVDSEENTARGEYRATWILASQNRAFWELDPVASRVTTASPVSSLHAWTDDYSSLLPILRWGRP